MPKRFRPGPPLLRDPAEHLVVLVAQLPVRKVESLAFDDDAGKGLLAVECGTAGFSIVCTHVTFGDKRGGQLAVLARRAAALSGTVVVAGDFNCPLAVARAGLPAASWSDVSAGPLRTRPKSDGGSDIDHVFSLSGEVREARVIAQAPLSDHNLVATAVVEP